MTNNHRDNLKETLKTDIELLKLFSVFVIALASVVGSMSLSYSFKISTVHLLFYIGSIALLIAFWMFFIIFVARIFKHLNQLKKT
jgi:TRAP-type C4-dicarboxylate transport system permease small subunit